MKNLKPYLIEFIGAFFLVLTIALSGSPIAIGFVLAALVYMGGAISGGHYNPAVTLAVLLTKNIKPVPAFIYMVAQILGGLVAALTFGYLHTGTFVPALGQGVTFPQALLIEALFTFLLCSAVLNTAVSEKTKGNSYFGLAIGLTVMAGAFAAGPISGAVFNPAVAVGPILLNVNPLTSSQSTQLYSLLIYLAGPFLGAALAAFIYKLK